MQSKAAIPALRATKGRIVVVSSGASLKGYASWGAYGSSKAAVNSLVQHLAVEEPSIVSVAVAPGRVDTDMQKQIREQGASGGMDAKVHATFVDAYAEGILNPPEKPSEVIAKLALEAQPELSGTYVKWVPITPSCFTNESLSSTPPYDANSLCSWNDKHMAAYHWA